MRLYARVFDCMSHDECSSHAQLQRMAAQIYHCGVGALYGNVNQGSDGSSVAHRMPAE